MKDASWRKTKTYVGMSPSECHGDHNGLLFQNQESIASYINSCCAFLRERTHHTEKYAQIAGHSGERCTYDILRKKVFRLHNGNDFNQTLCSCETCAHCRQGLKLKRLSQLFPVSSCVVATAINLLRTLVQTKHGNAFVIVIMECYSELTRAVTTSKRMVTDTVT